jgi:hypothetical protein
MQRLRLQRCRKVERATPAHGTPRHRAERLRLRHFGARLSHHEHVQPAALLGPQPPLVGPFLRRVLQAPSMRQRCGAVGSHCGLNAAARTSALTQAAAAAVSGPRRVGWRLGYCAPLVRENEKEYSTVPLSSLQYSPVVGWRLGHCAPLVRENEKEYSTVPLSSLQYSPVVGWRLGYCAPLVRENEKRALLALGAKRLGLSLR